MNWKKTFAVVRREYVERRRWIDEHTYGDLLTDLERADLLEYLRSL